MLCLAKDVLIRGDKSPKSVQGPVAAVTREALFVIHLVLDSNFLRFVDSTSAPKKRKFNASLSPNFKGQPRKYSCKPCIPWTPLLVLGGDDGGVRVDFGSLARVRLFVAGLAKELAMMSLDRGRVKFAVTSDAFKASLVKPLAI